MSKQKADHPFYDHDTGTRLFTIRQAAEYLHYHPYSVYRLVVQKSLKPYRKAGRTLLFLREELDRYRAGNAWASQKMSFRTLADAPKHLPPKMTATVYLLGGFELLPNKIETLSSFSWEMIPLIHARIQEHYRKRPSKIEVLSPEGGTWTILYEPPTWL
ncbi:MAG: helix-turn-helix domain-containing protein, partial [Nitrospiraceae bacterium]